MDFESHVRRDGVEHAATRIAEEITKQAIHSKDVALQFVLEELDAARQGNDAAVNFVMNSGFQENEYMNSMDKSFEAVDGPAGPQQMLLGFIMMISDTDLKVALRVAIVEKIMAIWKLGKYQ
jgi:hypothetical protein